MADNRSEEFQPVAGEEIGPARVKLLGMLLLSLLIIPAGAVAAFLWWYQVELFGGRVLTAKAGIAGLLAVPFGALLAIVGVVLLISAKRLVIAEECLQLLSRGRVVIHIPYANLAAVSATGGDGGAGVIGLTLRDRHDPATLV